jgi:hypothetical protein
VVADKLILLFQILSKTKNICKIGQLEMELITVEKAKQMQMIIAKLRCI